MNDDFLIVRGGLLDDSEHAINMGRKLYLYLYYLRKASKDPNSDGCIYTTDANVADWFGIPRTTVRDDRHALAGSGYIKCDQDGHRLKVTIMRFKNQFQQQWYNTEEEQEDPTGGQQAVDRRLTGGDQAVDGRLSGRNYEENTPALSKEDKDKDKDKDTDDANASSSSEPKPKKERKVSPESVAHYESGVKLAQVCNMPFEANKKRVLAEVKLLKLIPGYSDELLLQAFGKGGAWYARTNWRIKGNPNQPPSLAQVRETWNVMVGVESTTNTKTSDVCEDHIPDHIKNSPEFIALEKELAEKAKPKIEEEPF